MQICRGPTLLFDMQDKRRLLAGGQVETIEPDGVRAVGAFKIGCTGPGRRPAGFRRSDRKIKPQHLLSEAARRRIGIDVIESRLRKEHTQPKMVVLCRLRYVIMQEVRKIVADAGNITRVTNFCNPSFEHSVVAARAGHVEVSFDAEERSS